MAPEPDCPYCGAPTCVCAVDGSRDDYEYDDDYQLECTHCGGDGCCMDGSDPLGNCPDDPHRCHACGGSGKRKDQTIF